MTINSVARDCRRYLGLRTRAQHDSFPLVRAGDARFLAPLLDRLIDRLSAHLVPPSAYVVEYERAWLANATAVPRAALPQVGLVREAYAHAMRHWVLTFRESEALASRALRSFAPGAAAADLTCMREGNTSSVWRVTYAIRPGQQHVVGVLVPRDASADAEQSATLDQLSDLDTRLGDRVVRVHGRVRVAAARGPRRRTFEIAIVEWLEEAREIHVIPRETPLDGRARIVEPQVVVVEKFVDGDRPSGSLTDAHGSARILAACRTLMLSAVVPAAADRFIVPSTELNDGDFVLDRGVVRLVALSLPRPPRTAPQLIRDCALLSARAATSGQPIYLGRPPVLAAELHNSHLGKRLRAAALQLVGGADHPRVRSVATVLAAMSA